jgi:hypothetical protein
LNLDEDKNPEFFEIAQEHNELMDEWNRINAGLIEETQPIVFLYGRASYLDSRYGQPISDLQKQFVDWNKRASDLAYKPNLTFGEDEESELGFIHYTNVLRDLKNRMEDRMNLIVRNYNQVHGNHRDQVNFNIAIASFILAIIGVVLSFVSVL